MEIENITRVTVMKPWALDAFSAVFLLSQHPLHTRSTPDVVEAMIQSLNDIIPFSLLGLDGTRLVLAKETERREITRKAAPCILSDSGSFLAFPGCRIGQLSNASPQRG